MFSFGRRDEVSPTQHVLKLTLSSPKPTTPRFRGRHGAQPSPRHARIMEVDDADGGGVEVCLDHKPNRGGGPASPLETREPPQVPLRAEPVVSMNIERKRYTTVHQSQGSLQAFSFATTTSTASTAPQVFRPPKDHRIPLFGGGQVDPSYDDVVALLQHFHITSEVSAVQLELDLLQAEYAALERDQKLLLQQQQQQQQLEIVDDPIMPLRTPRFSSQPTTTPLSSFSLQQLLDSATLTNAERERLQGLRGNCWTVHIEQTRMREALLVKFGAKLSDVLKASSGTGNPKHPRRALLLPPADCLTLGPHNCRTGGAATHVRHLHLTCDSGVGQKQDMEASSAVNLRGRQPEQQPLPSSFTAVSGFVMSSDTGRAQSWGRLPSRLFRRFKNQKQRDSKVDSSQLPHTSADIQWLATGPMGSYVCKFISGELWWGLFQDADLQRRLETWEVHHVVLGPLMQTETGIYPSWLVIGLDGKVAWKNIPRQLEVKLKSRLPDSPAVDTVSLGAGGSYFVRYRDLKIDYCVSAEMATVCDYIHENGGTVTDIILHPESTNDFIIRHSELN
jgi:hypothetical protein